jgi:hypothetical protein
MHVDASTTNHGCMQHALLVHARSFSGATWSMMDCESWVQQVPNDRAPSARCKLQHSTHCPLLLHGLLLHNCMPPNRHCSRHSVSACTNLILQHVLPHHRTCECSLPCRQVPQQYAVRIHVTGPAGTAMQKQLQSTHFMGRSAQPCQSLGAALQVRHVLGTHALDQP